MNYANAIVKATKAFYDAINPATLSGAIDVIVVEQPDGEFKSTPFHIRFGKYGVWSHNDKYVDIEINGDEVDLKMKLGDSGVAYFVEMSESTARVADYLITSPIVDGMQSPNNPLNIQSTETLLVESARKLALQELPRRSEQKPIFTSEPLKEKSPPEQSLNSVHQVNLPFASSVFSSRKYRSLPQLNNILEDSDSDCPTTTKDDNFPLSPRRGRFYKNSRSHGGRMTSRNNSPGEPIKLRRKRNIRSKVNRLQFEDSDSEPELEAKKQNSNDFPLPGSRDNSHFSDGALSDSELDRHKKNEENIQNERMTDWKWGQLPETKENKKGAIPKKTQNSKWNWYFWRSSISATPKNKEEGISLDELQADPTKAEKYLGKINNAECNFEESLVLPPSNSSKEQSQQDKTKSILDNKEETPEKKIVTKESSQNLLITDGIQTDGKEHEQKSEDALSRGRIFSSSSSETIGEDAESVEDHGVFYYRSLRLSSSKLKNLGLKYGANEARFSITTMYQGTSWCSCNIYLYKWYEQIVISDIDGTITKSDVLGHVIPAIGGQWAHSGVVDLYSGIKNNGYKMVYLSSRAIGQSHITKQYLKTVVQDSKRLPDGPVLLSPSSVLMAFKLEVIERRPDEFKIAALADLKKLFPVIQPFYAGFGNRETDVKSYRAVDIPPSRVLIVDPSGHVRSTDPASYVSSYKLMATETVDYLFPPLMRDGKTSYVADGPRQRASWYQPLQFSTFTHWKVDHTDEVDVDIKAYEMQNKPNQQ